MPRLPPILKSKIIEAQQNSKSNMGAARYLGVSYDRYRRYAQLYGLFDSHLNNRGVGISKGFAMSALSIKLKDIFAGKHPNYPLSRLKRRLIQRGYLLEQCSLCHFAERRITDGRMPLILTFKDGVRGNMALDNLHLLCYNCMFLTTGLPSLVHKRQLETFAKHPHDPYPQQWHVDSAEESLVRPDPPDPDDPRGTQLPADFLTSLQSQLLDELEQERDP